MSDEESGGPEASESSSSKRRRKHRRRRREQKFHRHAKVFRGKKAVEDPASMPLRSSVRPPAVPNPTSLPPSAHLSSPELLDHITRTYIFGGGSPEDNPDIPFVDTNPTRFPFPLSMTSLGPLAYELLILSTTLLRSLSRPALTYILTDLRKALRLSPAEHAAHVSHLLRSRPLTPLTDLISRSADPDDIVDRTNRTSNPSPKQQKLLDRYFGRSGGIMGDRRLWWDIIYYVDRDSFLDDEEIVGWRSRWVGFVGSVVGWIVRGSGREKWYLSDILGRQRDAAASSSEGEGIGDGDRDEVVFTSDQMVGWIRKKLKQFVVVGDASDDGGGSGGSSCGRAVSRVIKDIIRLSMTGSKSREEIDQEIAFPFFAYPLFTSLYEILISPAIKKTYYEPARSRENEDFVKCVVGYLRPFAKVFGITRLDSRISILKCLFKYYMRIEEADEADEVYDDGLDDEDEDDSDDGESPLRTLEKTIILLLDDLSTMESISLQEKKHLVSTLSWMLYRLGRELAEYVDNYQADFVLLGNRLRIYRRTLRVWVEYVEQDRFFEDLYISNLRKIVLHSTRTHYKTLRDQVLAGTLGEDGREQISPDLGIELSSSSEEEEEEEGEGEEDSSDDEEEGRREKRARKKVQSDKARRNEIMYGSGSEVDEERREHLEKNRELAKTILRYVTLIDLVKRDIEEESRGVKRVFGNAFPFDQQVVSSYLDLLVTDLTDHLESVEALEDPHIKFFEKLKEFVVFAVKIHMRIDPHRSFATNEFLKKWERPVTRLLDHWFARIQDLFFTYMERSIKKDRWKPVGRGNKLYSTSVLDLFTFLRQSVHFLYNMCVPEIKRYFLGYAQMSAGLVQKYADNLCKGIPEDGPARLRPKPPPLRDIKMKVRLGILFHGGKKYDERLTDFEKSERDRRELGEDFGYEELYVRFNDLFYALLSFIRLINEMNRKWDELNEATHIDDSEDPAGVKARFNQIKEVTDGYVKQQMTKLADYIGARNVYIELDSILFQRLYVSRDGQEVETLESMITGMFRPFVADVEDQLMDKRLARLVLRSTFRHLMSAVAHVIVDGGDDRKFNIDFQPVLSRDLRRITAFFKGVANSGVDDALIRDSLSKLRTLLNVVMSKPSTELVSGSAENAPYSNLPEVCSGSSPWCKGTVYKVLYHRSDEVAVRFLGKHTYHYDDLWL